MENENVAVFVSDNLIPGMKRKDIPLEAKIVAVADIFDALTTDRSNRKAYTKEEGLEILSLMKNKNLAPEIFDVFISCIRDIKLEEINLDKKENYAGNRN